MDIKQEMNEFFKRFLEDAKAKKSIYSPPTPHMVIRTVRSIEDSNEATP